jgi:hypothetical protein
MGRINLRISDTNKDIIESAAAAAELSVTDFILQHAIQAAREELAAHELAQELAERQRTPRGRATKQLFIANADGVWRFKGRKLTVFGFVHTMRSGNLSVERAAEMFSLPAQAVEEAVRFVDTHRALFNEWLRSEEDAKNIDLWNAASKRSESGELDRNVQSAVFASSDFIFVSSPRGADFVDKLFKDGRRVTGRMVDDRFEAVD